MARKVLAVLVTALLVVSLLPAAGLAATGKSGGVKAAGMSAMAADYAAPDAYEPDNGTEGSYPLWSAVRDITSEIHRWDTTTPGWGIEPYTETHTIDHATTTSWDEDWVQFHVSTADLADYPNLSYRIDAYSPDPNVDLVLDVYGVGKYPAIANTLSGADNANANASNDDAAWASGIPYGENGRWSSVTLVPTAASDYWIRVRPFYHGLPTGFSGHAGAYTLRIKVGQTMRLYGATRVDTAVRISQEGWATNPAKSQEATVVLAYSQNYPDALAAASLAGACGTPVLLTPGDHLPASVKTEIQRLGVKGAYIIGGKAVIQNTVIEDLQVILDASRIKRIAGDDRYKTSIEVMKETKKVVEGKGQIMPKVAFIASGANYPDALALGPIAYRDRVPILLTPPAALNPDVASAIAMYSVADVVVAGGTGAVSAAVVNALVDDGMPLNRILRVSGADRYETAKEIAAWSCDLKGPGLRTDLKVGTTNNTTALDRMENANRNAFASGESYPDALAGAALAGKIGAPLLLTRKAFSPPILFGADGEIPLGSTQWFTDLATNGRLPIWQCYLLGGTAAVSDTAYLEIDQNTGWTP